MAHAASIWVASRLPLLAPTASEIDRTPYVLLHDKTTKAFLHAMFDHGLATLRFVACRVILIETLELVTSTDPTSKERATKAGSDTSVQQPQDVVSGDGGPKSRL